jgi:hypothetical protein
VTITTREQTAAKSRPRYGLAIRLIGSLVYYVSKCLPVQTSARLILAVGHWFAGTRLGRRAGERELARRLGIRVTDLRALLDSRRQRGQQKRRGMSLVVATIIAAATSYTLVVMFDLSPAMAVIVGWSLGSAAALLVRFTARSR